MAAAPSGCTCEPSHSILQQVDAGDLTDAVLDRLGQAAAAAAPSLTRHSALYVSVLPEWDAPGREQARAQRGRGYARPGVREGPSEARAGRRRTVAAASAPARSRPTAPAPCAPSSGASGCSRACRAARCRHRTWPGRWSSTTWCGARGEGGGHDTVRRAAVAEPMFILIGPLLPGQGQLSSDPHSPTRPTPSPRTWQCQQGVAHPFLPIRTPRMTSWCPGRSAR
jgi:hypothetical protein